MGRPFWLAGPLLCAAAAGFAPSTPAAAESLDLDSLQCEQVGRLAPDSVQTTVIGLLVGHAMGRASVPLDLEEANRWFAAFRDLCGQAPKARVQDVLPLLPDQVSRAQAPD